MEVGLYSLLAKVLYATYMIVSVKDHSCYESFQLIIIGISLAVVVGAVEPSVVANFKSPPATPTTKPLVTATHGELPCCLAAAVVWLLASVVGKLMSTPLSWH